MYIFEEVLFMCSCVLVINGGCLLVDNILGEFRICSCYYYVVSFSIEVLVDLLVIVMFFGVVGIEGCFDWVGILIILVCFGVQIFFVFNCLIYGSGWWVFGVCIEYG